PSLQGCRSLPDELIRGQLLAAHCLEHLGESFPREVARWWWWGGLLLLGCNESELGLLSFRLGGGFQSFAEASAGIGDFAFGERLVHLLGHDLGLDGQVVEG